MKKQTKAKNQKKIDILGFSAMITPAMVMRYGLKMSFDDVRLPLNVRYPHQIIAYYKEGETLHAHKFELCLN